MRRILTVTIVLVVLFGGCSVRQAIEQRNDYGSTLTDGEYSVTSKHYNTFGYKQTLSFTVKKGIISKVNYNEIDHNGISRLESQGLGYRWTGCEFTYGRILDHLYTDSILTQGKSIDTITGATKTSVDYETLQKALLEEIKSGKNQNIEIDHFNDVYQVTNEVDPVTGSQEQLTVEFVNGQLRSVSVQQVSNNAALYAIGRVYATLAEQTQQTHSLDPLNNTSVDWHILNRYNQLLEQVKNLRG